MSYGQWIVDEKEFKEYLELIIPRLNEYKTKN